MLKYLLFYMLTARAICAKPLPPQAEVPSHIVIVTPQAQVHLEPAVKYDTAFIHHLSPLARIASPHEETIVYVPASAAAAPIIPFESVSVGRAGGTQPQQLKTGADTKQFDQIQQQIQQAIQAGSSMLGPQLSEAANAAASAASSAGQGLFPALFPPPSGGAEDKKKPEKIIFETPAATETLLPASARLYAIAPAVSHVVDFVHSPVFVGPLSAIRARSIPEGEAAAAAAAPLLAIPLPEAQRPEALPLKEEFNAPKENTKELLKEVEPEKKSEFGRFLEANTLKEEPQQPEPQQLDPKDEKKEIPKLQEPLESLIAAKQLADEPAAPVAAPAPIPQLKTVAPSVSADAAVAPIVAPAVVPQVVGGIGEEVVVVPQVKVA